ncbi:recombinase family protein [Nocardioides sp. Soil777]|uniref:recombinase family protein n=1 Tax=Nocardioides sp. Soil777 TaxID=1736409 RepID=UPI0009EC9002
MSRSTYSLAAFYPRSAGRAWQSETGARLRLGCHRSDARVRATVSRPGRGQIHAIVVYNIDRLTRRPAELEHIYRSVSAANVTQVRFAIGDNDISTVDELMMARIIGAFTTNESAKIGRRKSRKIAGHRPAGWGCVALPSGGPNPSQTLPSLVATSSQGPVLRATHSFGP